MSGSGPTLDARGLPVGATLRREEVSPSEARERAAAGEMLIVDVRTAEEWDLVRLPGSVHVPLSELERRHEEIEPSEGQRVAFLCHHGVRSLKAVFAARAMGRPELADAVSVFGGLDLWAQMPGAGVARYERGPGVLRLR